MTNTVVNTITDFIPDCTPLVDVDDFHLAPLNFSISPNPTEGNVWIHLETRLENVQISVVHLNGKEIFQKNENAIFDAYRLDLKNIGTNKKNFLKSSIQFIFDFSPFQGGIFVMLIIGLSFSFIVTTFEFYFKARRRRLLDGVRFRVS